MSDYLRPSPRDLGESRDVPTRQDIRRATMLTWAFCLILVALFAFAVWGCGHDVVGKKIDRMKVADAYQDSAFAAFYRGKSALKSGDRDEADRQFYISNRWADKADSLAETCGVPRR